ncbi:MAG: MerR family DNA-binding protein [Spirochaetia bacterium]|nr:MerR family DNA-binding protein [Spirochaetia bacterium]
MNRSRLASLTDIPGRTIRFYEDKGFIPVPNRTANGYRDYDKNMVPLLKFIKNAQQLGFSLAEIKELSNMKVVSGSSCESVHKKAEQKIEDINRKISELYRIKDALSKFTQHCSLGKGIKECEFLHLLEK